MNGSVVAGGENTFELGEQCLMSSMGSGVLPDFMLFALGVL